MPFGNSYAELIFYVLILGIPTAAFWYFRNERLRDLETLVEEEKAQENRDEEWAGKFKQAADLVVKIGPKPVSIAPETSGTGFQIVFPSRDLRDQIEMHLVYHDMFHDSFMAKPVNNDELERAEVREIICEVLAAVEKFKQEYPEAAAKQLGI